MDKIDPPRPTTRIPELLSRPLTDLEYRAVVEALVQVGEVQTRMLNSVGGGTIAWRMEMASAVLADVFHMLDDFDDTHGTTDSEAVQKHLADVCVRRAFEIYGQGGA
jgi:hypothetical protein